MCVIIYVPTGEQISKQELKQAWRVNSDGAGFAVIDGDKVHYEKGFMTFGEFFQQVHKYIGGYELVIHFRISTSNTINQVQTHPYCLGAKKSLYGYTTAPVIAMNGIISGQIEYKGYNDTMSYLYDHSETFNILAENQSEDILNLIADQTGCKWAVVTPAGVIISDNFTEYKGKYYSNKNHLSTNRIYYSSTRCNTKTIKRSPRKVLEDYLPAKLWEQVKKDKYLYYSLIDFIDIWGNYTYIIEDVLQARTTEELKVRLWGYY